MKESFPQSVFLLMQFSQFDPALRPLFCSFTGNAEANEQEEANGF